jgi:hypothetical protein
MTIRIRRLSIGMAARPYSISLADHDALMRASKAAGFDTLLPHWIGWTGQVSR